MSLSRQLVCAALLSAITWTQATESFAATTCADPYGGAGTAAGVFCTQWSSRFDGFTDHAYIRAPSNYNPAQPVDLVLWFHAYFQGESSIADPRFHQQVGEDYRAITVGFSQRGDQDFMGDYTAPGYNPSTSARLASKKDIGEFLDQLSSRFRIRHVIVAGGSMGGYSGLRLLQQYPSKISIVLGAVPAICFHSDVASPNCTDSYVYQGSQEIYAAARAGVFDDKLVYNIPGSLDDTQGILAGAIALNAILTGKTWYRYRLIVGAGHENFLADEYNNQHGLGEKWLISNPAVPNLRTDITAYINAHTNAQLNPTTGWSKPTAESQEYIVTGFRTKGTRVWPDPADGGVVDASVADGSTVDSRVVDGSTVDSRVVDGSTVDSRLVDGSTVDGSTVDGSTVDSRLVDGSTVDGSTVDGSAVDGSTVDGPSQEVPPGSPSFGCQLAAGTRHDGDATYPKMALVVLITAAGVFALVALLFLAREVVRRLQRNRK